MRCDMRWLRVMLNQLIVVLIFLCTLSPATAADLRLAGHALGEPRERARADTSFDCAQPAVRGFTATCTARAPHAILIGAVPLHFFALHYEGEKLVAVEAHLPELRYQEAAQALAATSGEASVEIERLRSGMGAIFENAIHVWRDADAVLRFEQFFRSITTSSAILTTEPHLGKLVIPKVTNERTGIKDL